MRCRKLFRDLMASNGPFGEYRILDFYIRVEFHHRGSPHIHSLLWLKDAPSYVAKCDISRAECIKFKDRFITTVIINWTIICQHLFQIQYQSCKMRRKKNIQYRFGY